MKIKFDVTVEVAEKYSERAAALIEDAIVPLETMIADMKITVRRKNAKSKLHRVPGKKVSKGSKPKPTGKKSGTKPKPARKDR